MGAEYYYRKSGQIPAFGDWENANDLPITQYFECARQAGLLRCSCSGDCAAHWGGAVSYGAGYERSLARRVHAVPERKTRGMMMNKGYYPKPKEERKQQVKVRDLMSNQPRHHHHPKQHKSSISAKPVDEDLYKISPELLESSKRKKMLGFLSKCMVPPCAA